MRGSSEALRTLRIANDDEQARGGCRPVQIRSCDRGECRGIAPATRFCFDEHFHGHARHVAQRLREKSRLPIGWRRENYSCRLETDVDREESRIIARLGVSDASQADLENLPTGKGEAGSR